MLLSLDISTSCTGYAVFHKSKLINSGYINLSKHKGMFEKADKVKNEIINLYHEHNCQIKNVVVEENLQAFRPGLSSAKTLMTLAQFNGIVRWICHESLGVIVESINVNSARKSVGLKIDRKNKIKNTKQQVLEWVQSVEKNIDWPKKILKSGPRKGQEVYENYAYDIADAYVVGKSFCNENLM